MKIKFNYIIIAIIFVLMLFNVTANQITKTDSEKENIIKIIDAEHLDKNREKIKNIYQELKEVDDLWSNTIKEKEYVRVTFEKNLTNKNDITIYPRIISGSPKILIYEKDKNDLIAKFDSIKQYEYNKVFLTNLTNSQNTFDILIQNGSVEFDNIIDPTLTGNLTFYLNGTALSGTCPITSRTLGNYTPGGAQIDIWPGEFDAGGPGGADAGQWLPGFANRGNTTSSVQIYNASETTRSSLSSGNGWLYNENLTGYSISSGQYVFNLSLIGGQLNAVTAAQSIFARISVVACNGTDVNYTIVKDLTTTDCTGGSCSDGQAGWRTNEKRKIPQPWV